MESGRTCTADGDGFCADRLRVSCWEGWDVKPLHPGTMRAIAVAMVSRDDILLLSIDCVGCFCYNYKQ